MTLIVAGDGRSTQGRRGSAGLPSCSTEVPVGPLGGGQEANAGGPVAGPNTLFQRVSHGVAQGQWAGRCRTGRRWGRAVLAGVVTIWRRRVAPRATACLPPARVPAARSRL